MTKLNLKVFSDIRNKLINNYKNLTLEELIKKLDTYIPNLEYKIADFQYDYKDSKNNNIIRKGRVIFFRMSDNIKLLDKNFTTEFFVYITYKIVP